MTFSIDRFNLFNLLFQDFFRKSDVNESGDIDKAEFINYLREHEHQLHIVFSSLDENKDGNISHRKLNKNKTYEI